MCTYQIAKITNLGQQLVQLIIFYNYYAKMRLKNMLKIYLVFWKPEPHNAYKSYAYKKPCITPHSGEFARKWNY